MLALPMPHMPRTGGELHTHNVTNYTQYTVNMRNIKTFALARILHLITVEGDIMNHDRTAEIVGILMESDLYFEFTPTERLRLLKSVMAQLP